VKNHPQNFRDRRRKGVKRRAVLLVNSVKITSPAVSQRKESWQNRLETDHAILTGSNRKFQHLII